MFWFATQSSAFDPSYDARFLPFHLVADVDMTDDPRSTCTSSNTQRDVAN
jgi:hypothetical protein